MNGDVYEWCYDWYDTYPASAQNNPIGVSFGFYHVNRDGCRVASRHSDSALATLVLAFVWLAVQSKQGEVLSKSEGRPSKKAKPKVKYRRRRSIFFFEKQDM
jgi:hypothetical protein